ncbi:MAG TPA: alpha-amylase family protein [Ramlibacter sp.]
MRFRQIHLDFHTSGLIPGIGSRFDPEGFGRAFKDAYVDSVTVFAKCHHGWSYHPTEVGEMHPHLSFDLLRAQIDSLHAHGINAPVYLTATWDELAAERHPEWRTVSPDGTLPRFRAPPTGAGWAIMDLSTPYLDYLCEQTEEVMRRYPDADGIFMDICWQLPTISAHARAELLKLDLDWTIKEHRNIYTARAVENFMDRITTAVRKYDPKMPLFFNSGHIRRGLRDHYRRYYTHLELESLPTAGWGYDHFPLSARYVDPQGIPFLGMTGKFHFSWGEVGGYKKPDALLYECAAMLAQGARCSIGDHLHPTASIDQSTMRVIGPAYKWVADREPWATDSVNRAQIAVLSQEAVERPSLAGRPNHHVIADEGAVRVLMEGRFTFDVVDTESDFSLYELLILPDRIQVDDHLRRKVEVFVQAGGKVLLTGRSGIGTDGFVFDVGAEWEGTSPMVGGDYLLPIEPLRADGVNDPLFMYLPSERIRLTGGVSLGDIHDPYMDRRPEHFSGHVNAPSRPEPTGFAAGSIKGGFTYCANPIFTCYHHVGAMAILEIATKLVKHALGQRRLIETNLPSAGRVTIRRQAEHNRDIVHLLHATAALRGNLGGSAIQPIQDLVTLKDVEVALVLQSPVREVDLVPEGEALPFEVEGDILHFVVPRLTGHQMVEVRYQ